MARGWRPTTAAGAAGHGAEGELPALMELKFGLTLWTKQNRPPARHPTLRKNVRCDVAVIGAGVTGALVAHELVERGLRVVVLDKRAAGAGSTSASTALLLYETDDSLADLAKKHGLPAAVRTYRAGRRAIREIGSLVHSLHLDCGFSPKKCLYLASDRRGAAKLRREHILRQKAGLPGRWLGRHQVRSLFGLDFPGALYSPGCGQMDAVRFARQLLAHHGRRRTLRIFQGTQVTAVEDRAAGVRLRTVQRSWVDARYVVIATGYEAAPFLKDERVRLHSSYVVASRPLSPELGWKDRCLIWETARPYRYLRTTEDHRIVIGGEDEPFADPRRRDAKLPAKTRRLETQFRTLFPHLPFEREFAWTGTFVESPDGLPYIGPREPGAKILYALGYGGNGITFSQIAAKIIGRLCLARHHPDAALFRFGRQD